jgi:alpha-1,2-mannosyltransferase
MQSLMVNGLHLAGAVLGFFLIYRLSGSERYARFLWPVTLVMGAGMALYIFSNTHPIMFADFRDCYWLAGNLIWNGPQALIGAYDAERPLFVNIPVAAYLFAPFGLMSPMVAALVFTAIGVGVVALTWRMLVRLYDLDTRESAYLVLALCVFGPMLYTFREGNTSHFILALLVGGIALSRDRKDIAAGLVFGVAAIIKPALLLIGVFYFLRGRWRVAAGGGAVVLGTAVLSVLIFGWDMHVFWYESSIRPFTANPVPAYSNQTLQGMMARFEVGGPAGHDYKFLVLQPVNRLIAQAMTLALAAGALFAVWRSGRALRPTDHDIEVELLMTVTLAMLSAPLSWAHYYVWLFPALVMLWVATRPGAALQRMRWPLLGAFALVSGTAFVSASMTIGRFGPFANIVASHWLWGAIALLAMLAIVRMQKDPDHSVMPPASPSRL